MTKSKVIGLLILLLIVCSSVALAETDCLYYFYGKGCDSCDTASLNLQQLQDKYPDLTVKSFEVYYDKDNLDALNQYFQAYGISEEQRGVPAVFSATSYFVGEKPIKELLETHIQKNNNSVCPATTENKVLGVTGKSEHTTLLQSLTFLTVTKAPFSNYLSPGILAFIGVMLIITVILIASSNSKKQVLKKSIWFVMGGFLVYLLYVLGPFSWFGKESVAYYAYKVLGILISLFGLLLLRRHLMGKGELFEHLAHAQQQKWEFRRNVMFCGMGVFILGIITALFSLAGTSKVFGWMRYLVGGGEGTAIVTLWSIYYLILLFILPLAVAFLIFLIREVGEDAGERGMWIWKKKELWWINSVIAIIAVVLGIILLII
ncbi:MAG: hypothetical protein AABX04_06220 [Nanoarchaeota archaeon]